MDTPVNFGFSVLLPVYFREQPAYLSSALRSIWDDQSIKPSEIIIVKDGPLTNELDEVIHAFSRVAPARCVSLDKNCGLGIALARGLEACSNEIVARMDSDDIADSERFRNQISFLATHPEYDVIGSNIAEFDHSVNEVISYRKLPEKQMDIVSFARRRNPMNHMSVVFRKSAVAAAGSYIPFHGYEDYYLWCRMLIKGSGFYNLQQNLIMARIGNDMLARRQGKFFFLQELKLQKELHRIGFINTSDYLINLFLRAIPRLFPVWGLRQVYKFLRK